MSLLLSTLLLGTLAPREVTFTYVPGRPLQTVSVVGQFNFWDRAALPLQIQSDGKTWVGRTRIAPGVYQYLFVEDNRRWVPDPTAPTIFDGNGNTNSLLVVQPEEYDGKPGVEGDGIITASVLRHRPDIEDTVRVNRTQARLKFRTRLDDVEAVRIHVEGVRSGPIEARIIEKDRLFETWQATIPVGRGASTRYHVEFNDGPASLWLGPDATLSPTRPARPLEQPLPLLPLPNPPRWVRDAVFYQIFPERFENGDPSNDGPDAKPWSTTFTGANWRERVGGDLVGVQKRIGHLRELGVNSIYFNPFFQAIHNHAYDIEDYRKVDPRFGTNAELAGLMKELKRQRFRVLFDAVYNHSAPGFFAFQDLLKNQEKSPYRDWYFPMRYPVEVREGQVAYKTFAGVPTMPKLNQDNPATRDYFLDVSTYWIREVGIDGWRLDVADEVSHDFWKAFRVAVKRERPDAYILGEVWGDAHAWLQGDQHDAVMNYRWRRAVLDFLARGLLKPSEFDRALGQIREDYPDATLLTMFNLLGSHDTERVRTIFGSRDPRLALAFVLQFTYPGVPSVYYGDEIGMTGGKEPESRNPMIWDRSRWVMPLYDLHRELIRLRQSVPALRHGAYRTLVADDDSGVFSFERTYRGDRVTVTLNTGKASVKAPAGQTLAGASTSTLRPNAWTVRRG